MMDMRVNNVYSAYQVYNNSGLGKVRGAAAAASGRQDGFTISVQAEDYQQVRKALANVPDVRTDRVEDLQTRIASGLYSVSAAVIAEKLLAVE